MKIQPLLAEFLGTLVLIALGVGVVAMVVLFPTPDAPPGEVAKGGYTNITLGWGLAVLGLANWSFAKRDL